VSGPTADMEVTMLRIYRAPNGSTYQYEEGEQPEDYVLVDEPKAAPKKTPTKRRTTANKARKTENK